MEKPVVHEPEVGETLRHYLQRYTPEQRNRIYEHEAKSIEFSAKLLNTAWAHDSNQESIDNGLENLWKILERYRNFRPFLQFVEELEPVRRCLLETLDGYEEITGKISNWFVAGRILSSFADIAGTVLDYFVLESQPSYKNLAIKVAKMSGYVGFFFSFLEVKFSSDEFKDFTEQWEKDKKKLKEIEIWYQNFKDLEEEMKKIFPFDRTNKVIDEFVAMVEDKQIKQEELLSKLLKIVMNSDKKNEKGTAEMVKQESVEEVEQGSTKNLARVSVTNNNPSSTNDEEIRICERLICLMKEAEELGVSLYFEKHLKEDKDIQEKPKLKDNGVLFYTFQTICAFAPRSKFEYLLPRLGFNFFSMSNGIRSIYRCNIQKADIKVVRIRLKKELTHLLKIADFIKLKNKDGLLL